jgi:hypothetical protein
LKLQKLKESFKIQKENGKEVKTYAETITS